MAATNATPLKFQRKIALVIGNQNYQRSENTLHNSKTDAFDISAALRNIQFRVTTAYNLTYLDMVSTISNFSKTLIDGDLVLFYFSGHGYEINGKNYLMHIDDHLIESGEDVENYAIRLEYCLDQLSQQCTPGVAIFILDCCRSHHPKARQRGKHTFESVPYIDFPSEYPATNADLARVPTGVYIVFACSSNQTASDGEITDRNGLFAKHFLKHIAKPNKDITQLFRVVTNGVCIESKQKQKPVRIDGLIQSEQVYLNNKSVTVENGKQKKR